MLAEHGPSIYAPFMSLPLTLSHLSAIYDASAMQMSSIHGSMSAHLPCNGHPSIISGLPSL